MATAALRVEEKKNQTKEEVRELLQKIFVVGQEMSQTNVVSYPMKANVMRAWWTQLLNTHEELVKKLFDKDYRNEY